MPVGPGRGSGAGSLVAFAIGITTLDQISKMNDEVADVVNDAIEHFPGRIRRQGWVQQAKVILEDNLLSSL